MVTILKYASSTTIPHCRYNPYIKPYWNSEVKNEHNEERHKRKCWVADGRPIGMYFESYRDYKRANSTFRNVKYTSYEQYIQKTYDHINDASECHIRLFWKLFKKQKSRASKVYPAMIHNNTTNNNPESIVDALADYFYEHYQPNNNDTFDNSALENIKRLYSEITKTCKDEPNQLPGGVINVTKFERLSSNLIGGTLAVMIISTMNI